jgi:rhodanese-related sulfurtransferase
MIQLMLSAMLAFAGGLSARVPPDAALPKVQSNKAVVVDVREPDEVSAGKVKNALVFPTSKLGSPEWEKFVASLPKDKEIYTYCQRGGRADKVAEALRDKGFRASSTGGFQDWVKAGAKHD